MARKQQEARKRTTATRKTTPARKSRQKAPERSVQDPPENPETMALIQQEPARELSKPGEGVAAYPGATAMAFSSKEQTGLNADFDDDDLEITPDGIVYAPAVFYRERLDKVFGQGRHALIRQTKWEIVNGCVMATFHLYIDKRFICEATGDQAYHANNKRMTYGDAIEGSMSSALKRVCKKVGIGLKLWSPKYRREWRKKMATRYWCRNKATQDKKPMWYRNDNEEEVAFPWEITGLAPVIKQPKPTGPKPGKKTPPPKAPPAKTTKKDTTPEPPPSEFPQDEAPAVCEIMSTVPPLKQGNDTVYRYMIQDETGTKWWGATKNEGVADVLASCFQQGTPVQLTFKLHEKEGVREILSVDPLTK